MSKEVAFLSGLFQGEGCVRIQRAWPRRKNTSRLYWLMILVGNTDLACITPLVEKWGGSVHSRPASPGMRKYWTWQTQADKAAGALGDMLPYLVGSKKEQAILGIEFQKNKIRQSPLSVGELAKREDYYWRMRNLK